MYIWTLIHICRAGGEKGYITSFGADMIWCFDQYSHLLSLLWCSRWWWGCLRRVNGDGIDTAAKWSVLAGGWFHLQGSFFSSKGFDRTEPSSSLLPSTGRESFISGHLRVAEISIHSLFRTLVLYLCNDNTNLTSQAFWLSGWLKSAVDVCGLSSATLCLSLW